MTQSQKKRVCVTGASGFLGTHVIRVLLERGYAVRGTVRDAKNPKKVEHLQTLAKELGGDLEFVSADLTVPGSLDDAVKGCEWVCHVASAVKLTAKDPQKEIVDVAVHGTEQIMEACRKAKEVKRLVITSSVAAIYNETPRPTHTYTEADWNESATLKNNPYALSKTLAEKAAWDLWKKQPEDERVDLITICPALVWGPVYTEAHLHTSPAVLYDVLLGKFPAIPNFSWGIVDVRDVAEAHVLALEKPHASGRYLCSNQALWLHEAVQSLSKNFPNIKLPKRRLPDWTMYIVALFDKRLSFGFLRRNLSTQTRFENKHIREDLGLSFRPLEQTIVDMCQSFVDRGFLKK
ncbi:MAG: SDR family oxidoreductase [Myxococcales bacterium]|nr:SDR family oxidoreductase [Myxococcales bacterium]